MPQTRKRVCVVNESLKKAKTAGMKHFQEESTTVFLPNKVKYNYVVLYDAKQNKTF